MNEWLAGVKSDSSAGAGLAPGAFANNNGERPGGTLFSVGGLGAAETDRAPVDLSRKLNLRVGLLDVYPLESGKKNKIPEDSGSW